MNAETPADGVMKTHDFGNAKVYKVACRCGQPDHEINVEVESTVCGIDVNTYINTKTDYWTETFKKRYDINNQWLQELDWCWKDLINGVVSRVKLTWTIWTKGYVETQSTISMSEQQALNYSEILKSAINDVKDFKKP
jgi:hypothetical protein